jgi:hypothetical protein
MKLNARTGAIVFSALMLVACATTAAPPHVRLVDPRASTPPAIVRSASPDVSPAPTPTPLPSTTPVPSPSDLPTATPQPTPTPTPTPRAGVSFLQDVQPLVARCAQCHGTGFSTYDGAKSSISSIINATQVGFMPRGGPRFTDAEVQVLKDWSAAGTPDN